MIRAERPSDVTAISEITREAFLSHPHSEQTEHFIINALRASGALSVSLVAELSRQVVGHIAFSPVTIDDGSTGWYGLGPLAVKPEFQSQGIGQALVREGIVILRRMEAHGCVVVGAEAYYRRFGFQNCTSLVYVGLPPEYFHSLLLHGAMPSGRVTYHPAFNARS
jgi:putative acetyltransferase